MILKNKTSYFFILGEMNKYAVPWFSDTFQSNIDVNSVGKEFDFLWKREYISHMRKKQDQ